MPDIVIACYVQEFIKYSCLLYVFSNYCVYCRIDKNHNSTSLNLWYACRLQLWLLTIFILYLPPYWVYVHNVHQLKATCTCALSYKPYIFCLSFSSCLINNGAKLSLSLLSICSSSRSQWSRSVAHNYISHSVLYTLYGWLCLTDLCIECLKPYIQLLLMPYIQLLLWKCRHENISVVFLTCLLLKAPLAPCPAGLLCAGCSQLTHRNGV